MEQLLQNTYWTLAEDLRPPKRQETPPHTWVGQKKKQRQKNRNGTGTSGRELWRRKGFHTLGNPSTGRDCGWLRGEALELRRRAQQQECREQSGEIPAQRIRADQHSPAQEACLLTHRGGRGLGAEARALVGTQGEDWGWRREHSLKGASVPRLARRESGKSMGLPKRQETFSCLFVSWCARRGD